MAEQREALKKLGVAARAGLNGARNIRLSSALDRLDPEVAKKALEKYPDLSNAVTALAREHRETLDRAMAQNGENLKTYNDACNAVLAAAQELLRDESRSFQEKKELLGQMRAVTREMGERDAENKRFLRALLRTGALTVCAAGLVLLAALGGRAQVEK